MRKLLLSTALTLGVGAFALQAPAYADDFGQIKNETTTVNVYATVDKHRDKRVVEFIGKIKLVGIFVIGLFYGNSAAESDLIVDQQNIGNTVDHLGPDNPPLKFESVSLAAAIVGSVNDNTGVVQLNQDTGNMVNQANVLSVAAVGSGVFVDSQAAAQQDNLRNTSNTQERPVAFEAEFAQKTALIANSVNRNTGVVGLNQNVGNMNNQLNAVSLAVGLEADFALADAALGQFNTGNTVSEQGTIRTATIRGSVNYNTGITGVNQATGNMNNQATVISFAGAASF